MKTTQKWSKMRLVGMVVMVLAFGLVVMGCNDGNNNSNNNNDDPNTVATPMASPVAGAVASGTTVTLSTTTGGATIHYTTNGSTPTESSPTYSTPISITTATTIKAIAVKSGMTDSGVLSAAYTIASGGAKPTVLANDATDAQALAKVEEIIAYSGTPALIRATMQVYKSQWVTYSTPWSTQKTTMIPAINGFISQIP